MENIGRRDHGTLIALGKSSFEKITLAQVKADNLAERIAAVLNERRRIGKERRRRAQERLLRKNERAQSGERRRDELRELDELCAAVISSNAADDAMNEHEMWNAS